MSTRPQIVASSVTFAYRGGPEILRGVDLEVGTGEVVGLVGESGCGKSTLARLLVGVHEPASGEIRRSDPGARVQMIFQDPYAALNPRLTALVAVAEACRVCRRLSRGAAVTTAVELLEQVGIGEEAMRKRSGRLSGGQCQRVSIARALAADPATLVADEPTSSLDVSVQAQILNLLRKLQRERGLSILLVSHDLAVIRYMADRTYVMYKGEVVEDGPTDDVYETARHPYTRHLIDSAPGAGGSTLASNQALGSEPACAFATSCARRTEECVDVRPEHAGLAGHNWRCHHPLVGAASS